MTAKLTTPDASLRAVEKLCGLVDPYAPATPALDALFLEAMREITAWHIERSEFYRRVCEKESFVPATLRTTADLANIPSIPAEFFKLREVLSIPHEAVTLHLTSSGTTGQKSQIFFDAWSIGSAQRMVDFIFEKNGWVSPEPVDYLLFSYETDASSKLGTAYTDHFLCKYAPAHRVFCALRRNGQGTHDFDLFGTLDFLEQAAASGRPVRIFGFPAFLAAVLERGRELGRPALKLNPRSFVFLGGGWKKHTGKILPKRELYALATERLGIPDDRLRDGFGSVEHCVPYVECQTHRFHVPVWSRVFIRDVDTGAPLAEGKQGLLHFVSPYITSVPAHSVVMGDVASLHANCGCGLPTPYFELHGRAGTSKNRSCAVAAAELLGRGARS